MSTYNIIAMGYALEFNSIPPERFLLTKFSRNPEKAEARAAA